MLIQDGRRELAEAATPLRMELYLNQNRTWLKLREKLSPKSEEDANI
jgi:hypothetical protein